MSRDKEIFAFDIFRELYGQFPSGEKTERPDFIVTKDGLKIGIELTELIDEESDDIELAAKYSLEDKIVKLSRIEFDSLTDKKINVAIKFADDLKIRSNRLKQLSNEISSIIIKVTKEYPNILIHNLEINDNLPNEVNGIYFDIAPFLDQSQFMAMRGKWPKNFDLITLNKIIKRKESNITTYRKLASLIYLIIIEGFVPNSWYGDFIKTGTVITNGFDKIFLLRIMSRQLYEIK